MDLARRVLLQDFGVTLIAAAVIGMNVGVSGIVNIWLPGVPIAAVGIAALLYLFEHHPTATGLSTTAAARVGLAAVALLVVATVALALLTSLALVGGAMYTVLAGLVVGFGTYRLAFGVVRPVPDARLARQAT